MSTKYVVNAFCQFHNDWHEILETPDMQQAIDEAAKVFADTGDTVQVIERTDNVLMQAINMQHFIESTVAH